MTKLELAKELAQAEGITITKARSIVDNIMDLIICHLIEGEAITLRGFGTLKIRRRRSFTGLNPQTLQPLSVADRKSVAFKPSAELIERIN